MRFVMFYHSLVSDWNHGNAHFLRGVASELLDRGHDVAIYEPADGWSRQNLIFTYGDQPLRDFDEAFPHLHAAIYDFEDLDAVLEGADVVIVHEWNPARLVAALGEHRRQHRYRLFFHDTHHRSVSDPDFIAHRCLRHYDGVLAFGESLRREYDRHDWSSRVWVWHEGADTRIFHPQPRQTRCGDLVWIGNWGDDERTRELDDFLLTPVRKSGLRARVYGVRYPQSALAELAKSGVQYAGWAPNYRVPQIFAGFDVTVHIPRRPYREQLPGVPTIRVFEALACGIPLICAPWNDCEHLFEPGRDYWIAQNTSEMIAMLSELIHSEKLRAELSEHGLSTLLNRHTCAHRVDQLLEIVRSA